MRITGKASIDLKKYRAKLKARTDEMRTVIGDKIADQLVEEVKTRIPDQGGWFEIYRNAIQFNHDDGTWTVLGETDIELTQVPAAESLVTFSGGTDVAAVLSQFNPFPVDTIPPVTGGISASVTVLPASSAEVMSHRERHADIQSNVTSALGSAGFSVDWAERPIINGQVTADLKFLSRRLEHGLGGFPRVRHWEPAAQSVERNAPRWIKNDQKVVEGIEKAFKAQERA